MIRYRCLRNKHDLCQSTVGGAPGSVLRPGGARAVRLPADAVRVIRVVSFRRDFGPDVPDWDSVPFSLHSDLQESRDSVTHRCPLARPGETGEGVLAAAMPRSVRSRVRLGAEDGLRLGNSAG
jgi:hypothetical protein